MTSRRFRAISRGAISGAGGIMVAASLSLRGLTRLYGPVRAVDDLDLEVPEGAFVTLLGPSGCGKSTTLNLIAGLDEPTAGTIMLGDRDVTNVPPNERRMAMVFQNYALYPNMTVFENIGVLAQAAAPAGGRDQRARHGRGRDARHRAPAPSQAGRAVGRPAAAGRARAGAREAAAGLPARRAVQQPRRRRSGRGCGPRSSTSTWPSGRRACS